MIALAGVNTGNNLVYLMASFLLAYMLLSGWLAQVNLKGLVINVWYPETVFADMQFPIFAEIYNTKRFVPSFFLKVRVADYERFIFTIGPREKIRLTFYMVCSRRGINNISEPRVFSSFPFNFFTRMRPIGNPDQVLAFPRPKPCHIYEIKNLDDDTSRQGYEKTMDYEDLISIRNYIPGDPWKLINWKATAKTDDLKVNELDTRRQDYIILDLTNISSTELEAILSCYTFIVLKLSKEVLIGLKGHNIFIPPNIGRDHENRILTILALYDDPRENN